MTTTPQDHKKKKETPAELKRKQQMAAEFMSTGIDFTPFTIDAGDGVEWEFVPDPMPAQTEALSKAMAGVSEAAEAGEGSVEAYEALIEAIKAMMVNEKQKKEFPLPIYGTKAYMFFALNLATGRDGFPTEEG